MDFDGVDCRGILRQSGLEEGPVALAIRSEEPTRSSYVEIMQEVRNMQEH